MPNLKQKGSNFTPVAVVILLVIMCGLMAWYILQNNTNNNHSKTESTMPTASNYFVIKEWNVRAPYNGTFTLTYTISDGTLAEGATSKNSYAQITATQLVGADPECRGRGANIQKYLPTDTLLPFNERVSNFIKENPTTPYSYINGYYYIFETDQEYCSTKDPAIKLESKLFDDIRNITKKLKATK